MTNILKYYSIEQKKTGKKMFKFLFGIFLGVMLGQYMEANDISAYALFHDILDKSIEILTSIKNKA